MANVRLGLLAMGKSPDEVRDAMPDVLELAGIGRSIHLPMKTYSSGHGRSAAFRHLRRCPTATSCSSTRRWPRVTRRSKERSEARMAEIRREAGTVFLVSHAAQTIEEMCTRAIWLHEGEMVADGPAYETARAYRWWAWNVAKGELKKAEGLLEDARATLASHGGPPARTPRPTATSRRQVVPELRDTHDDAAS